MTAPNEFSPPRRRLVSSSVSRMACASFFSDLPPKFPVSSLLFFPSSQSLVPPSPRPSPPVAESNKPGLLLPKSSLAETSEGVTLLAFSVPLHWKRPAWSGRVEENRSFRFFFCLWFLLQGRGSISVDNISSFHARLLLIFQTSGVSS